MLIGIPMERELEFARRAVTAGAVLARRVERQSGGEVMLKGDHSPVTLADFAVQALVAAMLEQEFPGEALVAEEDSAALREPAQAEMLGAIAVNLESELAGASPEQICRWVDRGGGQATGRFWTLDPIDGTKGFLRGEQYVVGLALIEQGEVILGALGCPNLDTAGRPAIGAQGSIAWATRGSGAWIESLAGRDRKRLRVSSCREAGAARLFRSAEESHTDPPRMQALVRSLGLSAEPVLMDSQAKYVALAAGQGEFIVRMVPPQQPDRREKIWDLAAGALIVEQAGGKLTDLDGAHLDYSAGRELARNAGVLASNGLIHEAVLAAFQATRPGRAEPVSEEGGQAERDTA